MITAMPPYAPPFFMKSHQVKNPEVSLTLRTGWLPPTWCSNVSLSRLLNNLYTTMDSIHTPGQCHSTNSEGSLPVYTHRNASTISLPNRLPNPATAKPDYKRHFAHLNSISFHAEHHVI